MGANGEVPNIVFILGGTNDAFASTEANLGTIDDVNSTDYTLFYPALAHTIDLIRSTYEGVTVYFILNDDFESYLDIKVRTAIKDVCSLKGVDVIEPVGITKSYSHPDAAGMERIAQAVKKWVVDGDKTANSLQGGDGSRYWVNFMGGESTAWASTGRAQLLKAAGDGLYEIKDLTIPEGTENFAITESIWANTLVATTPCSAGVYDLTFDATTSIATLTPKGAGMASKYNFYYWTEADGNVYTPFLTTSDADKYIIEGFQVKGSYNFCVTTSDWTEIYGNNWAENFASVGVDYALTAQTTANTWMALAEGYYNLILTITESGASLRADTSSAAINNVINDSDAPIIYYNLNGTIVDAQNLNNGIFNKCQGYKVEKILCR